MALWRTCARSAVQAVVLTAMLAFVPGSPSLAAQPQAAQPTCQTPRSAETKAPGAPGAAELYTAGIVTGQPDETDFALASDLGTVLSLGQETGPRGETLRLLPVAGTGGVQAIRDLLSLRGIDFAITSTPVLDHLRETKELGPLEAKIVAIARMPDKEVHVLAVPEVQRIQDLAGKTVNFGPEGSDSAFIARRLFDAMDLQVTEANVAQADALESMRTGAMSATILVTGKPAPILQHLGRTTFHFLPVEPPGAGDRAATLTSRDYPNLIGPDEQVATISVPSALVAYNRAPGSRRYNIVQYFAESFLARFDEFQRPPRHPKWREVDLYADIPGWRRFAPVAKWVREQRPDASATSSVELNGNDLSESEAERLFQEFLRWRKQRRMPGR
jgi:uncharacterized protein